MKCLNCHSQQECHTPVSFYVDANIDALAGVIDTSKTAAVIADSYDVSGDSGISFCEKVSRIIDIRGWSYTDFEDNTLLNRNIYYDIRSGKLLNPAFETVIALCIGLDLRIHKSEELLSDSGYTFRNTETHNAYRMLISCCAGTGIIYCNSVLIEMGLAPLGAK